MEDEEGMFSQHEKYGVIVMLALLGVMFAIMIQLRAERTEASLLRYERHWNGEENRTEEGRFTFPYDVAVDSHGDVYVADYLGNRIQKFDAAGNYLLEWKVFSPTSVKVGPEGRIFVADAAFDRIRQYTPDGQPLLVFGQGSGPGQGQLDRPHMLAFDAQGRLYVADSGNDRIQVFDREGSYLFDWGETGDGDGQFNAPEGLAINLKGEVFVSDQNYRIQKFTGDGQFLAAWGTKGNQAGEFNGVLGLTIDERDQVLAAWIANVCNKGAAFCLAGSVRNHAQIRAITHNHA